MHLENFSIVSDEINTDMATRWENLNTQGFLSF